MGRPAAFFDMDRTLIRCNSATRWIAFSRRRGELSLWRTFKGLTWVARYKLSILDMEAVTEHVIKTMRGDLEEELASRCQIFFREEVAHTIAPRARQAVEAHRQKGHVLAILTSSTPYVPTQLARELAIEHIVCTRLAVEEGRFAGSHVKPACYGHGKVHWAERFSRDHDIDLSQSFFYTDSYSDLPMLERVGEPRVINADPRLRRHAERIGWPMEIW